MVHPPVEVERFAAPDMTLLRSLPGRPEPGYYLCFGELVHYKRVDLAVRACARTGRRLLVAGDGAERQRLEALGGPSVSFLGRVPDEVVPALYAGCRGFLFPGEEDFGITPVEAMAAGRPVIAYGRGGVLDSVVEGETGIFFGEQTVESLIEALDCFEQKTFSAQVAMRRAGQFDEHTFREAFLRELEGIDALSRHAKYGARCCMVS